MSWKRHHSHRQVRAASGCFVKVRKEPRGWQTPEERHEGMAALYAWRDERRLYAQQLASAKRDARVAPLRSIALLSLMSVLLGGLLLAGAGVLG